MIDVAVAVVLVVGLAMIVLPLSRRLHRLQGRASLLVDTELGDEPSSDESPLDDHGQPDVQTHAEIGRLVRKRETSVES